MNKRISERRADRRRDAERRVDAVIPATHKRSPAIRRTKSDRRYHVRRHESGLRSSEEERLSSKQHVAGSTPAGDTRHPVVVQEWDESERGWGVRSDGASLHLTQEDRDQYIKDYWASMPDTAPHVYSKPDDHPRIIDVDEKTYQMIAASKNGIRLWQDEYRTLVKR